MLSKKNLSALTTGILFAFAGLNAHAGTSGTVSFTGTVIADSCSIDVNSSGSNTGTVPMPVSYTSDFAGADKTAQSQDFDVALTGCDNNINQFAIAFTGSATANDNTILETTGSAKNIGIRLYDMSKGGSLGSHKVQFAGENADANLYWQDAVKTGDSSTSANFHYIADVVQVGEEAPTTGVYSAMVSFEIQYQ